MARLSRGARVSRGTSAQRKWVWARQATTVQVPAGLAVFENALADFEGRYGADLLGATIMRIRGEFKTDQSVILAMRVFNEPTDGVASMTQALHGPSNVPQQDWFVWQPVLLDVVTGVRVKEIDVKASRKMEELQQGLLLAVSNLSSAAVNLTWNLSIGLKLP